VVGWRDEIARPHRADRIATLNSAEIAAGGFSQ